MKNNKYLNIRMDGEKNIGVIDLGVVYTDNKKKIDLTMDSDIRLKIESKVVEALSAHFDCEIKIIHSELKKLNPLVVNVEVIVKSMDEDYQTTVYLEETWLY